MAGTLHEYLRTFMRFIVVTETGCDFYKVRTMSTRHVHDTHILPLTRQLQENPNLASNPLTPN